MWGVFQLDFLRALFAMLPAPLLWGASFPLAIAAAGDDRLDAAEIVGRVYAANTVGAIAGALGTSLLLVRWLGSQHTQQVMELVAITSALLMLLPVASTMRARIAVGSLTVTLLLQMFGRAAVARSPRRLRSSRGGLGGSRQRNHLRRRRHARVRRCVADGGRRAELPQRR